MSELWLILLAFLFRVCFGVSVCMAITPARLVTSGFYRVHLWMIMGFATFASLIAYSQAEQLAAPTQVLAVAIAIAVASYLGAVVWLYQKQTLGVIILWLIAIMALAAATWGMQAGTATSRLAVTLSTIDTITGGLLLGVILTAMLLGHWYLNTPTMQLAPLRMLIVLMAITIVARGLVSAGGLVLHVGGGDPLNQSWWLFVALRWLSGIVGTAVMTGMTWQTLKIPNTQSATGILYAGVILAFIGELTSQLLSVDTLFPV